MRLDAVVVDCRSLSRLLASPVGIVVVHEVAPLLDPAWITLAHRVELLYTSE